MSPSDLQVLIRGAAVGSFLVIAAVLLRPPRRRARTTGVLFSLSAAAHTLTQMSGWEGLVGTAAPPIWTFSAVGAGLFWAFATELFEDRNLQLGVRFLPAALLLAVGLGATLGPAALSSPLLFAHNLLSALLLVHVIIVIWRGWRDDLVEGRRQLRGPILVAAAVYGVSVVAVQTAELASGSLEGLAPIGALALLGLGLAAAAAFLRTDPALFARTNDRPVGPADTAMTPDDLRTADRLEATMRCDRAYRNDQLSVGALAATLGLPEYQLRRLINHKLGHRNFAAYLNQWRIEDVKQALADAEQREVPISTIALDAGFGSLGAFNRAFKEATGVTPSLYRDRVAPE